MVPTAFRRIGLEGRQRRADYRRHRRSGSRIGEAWGLPLRDLPGRGIPSDPGYCIHDRGNHNHRKKYQNSDTSSGDYDFLYREYSTQGRWVSPDPAGLAVVDPTLPQSWNRYAYVFDNPLAFVDPLGLCGETPSGPYDYSGCSHGFISYPRYDTWPCFGFIGYWHLGCPK